MTHIHDSLFIWNEASVSANGDRVELCPECVCWEAYLNADHPSHAITWFTDGQSLLEPCGFESNTKVIWLLEPRALHPENYEYVEALLADSQWVDHVFTHDSLLLARGDARVHPYPHGGTRIEASAWRMYDKTQRVSIIASEKRSMPGHKARHELIALLRDNAAFHAFGPEYQPIEHKLSALAPYTSSVVIENVHDGVWFTEALLDCFLTGTMPIYYGDPRRICDQWGFDLYGITWVPIKDDVRELAGLVKLAADGVLDTTLESRALLHNFARAHEYVCTEDWLQRNYPHLFEESP